MRNGHVAGRLDAQLQRHLRADPVGVALEHLASDQHALLRRIGERQSLGHAGSNDDVGAVEVRGLRDVLPLGPQI